MGTGRTRVGTTNARALIPLSAREVTRWLQPWPIQLRGGRFHLEIVPISRCERFYAFWRTGPRSEYRTIAWWAKMAATYKAPGEQHYIHMLARDRIPVLTSLTIVVIQREGKWIVVDGNHHLIGLALVRRHRFAGKTALIKYVGVLRREP